ncbi:hypothetical protein BZG36_04010 [Bifiguratus adelaidae]|uniref:Alpha/beta hydrolase fold-3 domain-containing protein n=1 Tax=Bifiguratus adelaidae TaxID=1938954 RepID=A0A261XYG6_9FUNG|nr:hypothetical protein BZG36_04010 [Bifiguratus adelaidae]
MNRPQFAQPYGYAGHAGMGYPNVHQQQQQVAMAQQHFQFRPNQQPTQRANVPASALPYANQKRPSVPNAAAGTNKVATRPGQVEAEEEPSGDELDSVTTREVSMARYKRNHDYLAEVFSPYPVSSILPPPLDLPVDRKAEFEAQLASHEKEMQDLRQQHNERIAEVQRENEQYWAIMRDLDKATTLEEIEKVQERMSAFTNLPLEKPLAKVRQEEDSRAEADDTAMTFSLPTKAARAILEDITKPLKEHKPWIRKSTSDKWKGYWIGEEVSNASDEEIDRRVRQADVVLFYVHGGGFRLGQATMCMDAYIGWIKVLQEQHGFKVIMMSVHHGLAPECKYPEPLQDVMDAYEHLVRDLNVPGSKVVMVGDSSGAALCLETLFISHDPSQFVVVVDEEQEEEVPEEPKKGGEKMDGKKEQQRRNSKGDKGNDRQSKLSTVGSTVSEEKVEQLTDEALPRPAGVIMISPIVTDDTTSRSWQVNQKYDFVTQYTAKVIKRDYIPPEMVDDVDGTFLGLAKLEEGFSDWLPHSLLFYIGGREVLRDDDIEFAEKLKRNGLDVQVIVEPKGIHDWFCIRETFADKKALQKADLAFGRYVDMVITGVRRASVHHSVYYTPSVLSTVERFSLATLGSQPGVSGDGERIIKESELTDPRSSVRSPLSDHDKLPFVRQHSSQHSSH